MIIMKKLTSLLIGCSLALAGAALAQQPVEQQSPSKGKHAPEKAHPAEAQPKPNAAQPHAPPATQQHGAMKEHGATTQHGATNEPGAMKEQGAMHQPGAMKERGMTNERGAMNQPGAGKGQKAPVHQESATAPATGTDASGHAAGMPTKIGKEQQVKERKQGQGVKQPATEAGATSVAGQQNM